MCFSLYSFLLLYTILFLRNSQALIIAAIPQSFFGKAMAQRHSEAFSHLGAPGSRSSTRSEFFIVLYQLDDTSNKCHASSNRCLTSSNKEAIRIKFKVN